MNNKISFAALFIADVQMTLLGQRTSTNSCLLMHSILVQINELKNKIWFKVNLVIHIIGLYFIKWENLVAHGKMNLPKLAEV